MQQIDIKAPDGTVIPLTWFAADQQRIALLLLPALGIQARLYNKLAEGLSELGCSVCLIEQRGHGRSALRPGYGVNYSLDEILDQDLPAAMAWLASRAPALPLLLGGHSLGGHLSTIYAGQHAAQLAGVVHLACAFPYHRAYGPKQARMLRTLCRLMPLFAVFPGYFPGDKLGFGGRESLGLMRQWCEWAQTGQFDFGGRNDLAGQVAAFAGPVISIAFDKDGFASDATIDLALSPFTNARITRRQLGAAEQGEYLGHVAWAREPAGVVQVLGDWLATEFKL